MDLRGKMTLYVPEVLAIIKYVRNLRNKAKKIIDGGLIAIILFLLNFMLCMNISDYVVRHNSVQLLSYHEVKALTILSSRLLLLALMIMKLL